MHAPLADSREVTPPRSTPVAAVNTFAAVVGTSRVSASNEPLMLSEDQCQSVITKEKSFEEIGTPTFVPCYKSDEERQGLVQLEQLAFVMFGLLLNAIASFVCGILISNNCPEHYRYLPVYLVTVGVLFIFVASTYITSMACGDCLCCLATPPRSIDIVFSAVLISGSNAAVGFARLCDMHNDWLQICGLTSLAYCTMCILYQMIVRLARQKIERDALATHCRRCALVMAAVGGVCLIVLMPGYPLYCAIRSIYRCPHQPLVSICLFLTAVLIIVYLLYVVTVYALKGRPYPICSCTSKEFTLPWLIIANLLLAGFAGLVQCSREVIVSASLVALATIYAPLFLKVIPIVLNMNHERRKRKRMRVVVESKVDVPLLDQTIRQQNDYTAYGTAKKNFLGEYSTMQTVVNTQSEDKQQANDV